MEDAIDSFLKYHSVQDRVGKERFCEAEEWITATRAASVDSMLREISIS
jgi:hypothetical protein